MAARSCRVRLCVCVQYELCCLQRSISYGQVGQSTQNTRSIGATHAMASTQVRSALNTTPLPTRISTIALHAVTWAATYAISSHTHQERPARTFRLLHIVQVYRDLGAASTSALSRLYSERISARMPLPTAPSHRAGRVDCSRTRPGAPGQTRHGRLNSPWPQRGTRARLLQLDRSGF